MTQNWGNEEFGSLSQYAKAGHGKSSEDGQNQGRKHRDRVMATEGQTYGPAADAQRAGHTLLAGATSELANRTAEVGNSTVRGERLQGQVADESASMQSASASDNEGEFTFMKRDVQA